MEFFNIDYKPLLAEKTYDGITPVVIYVTPEKTIVKENPTYQKRQQLKKNK